MTRHISIMVIICGGTLLVCGNFGDPNPQLTSPYILSPNRHQQLLGPYYQPFVFSLHYPSKLITSDDDSGMIWTTPTLIHPKIVGGFPVPDGLVPFMAGLFIQDAAGEILGTCGGTLITPRHILTAAHCFPAGARPIGSDVIINNLQLSTKKLSNTAVARKVKAFKIHELFKFITLPNNMGEVANGYDIALLTLDQDVTTVNPVKLAAWDQGPIDGKISFATGWGLTNPANDESDSKFLLGTVLTIASNDFYNKIKGKGTPDIKGSQLSAYYLPGGRGVCSGDSGGPLFIGNQKIGFLQVGITSYGNGDTCGLIPDSPGVFTRVSRFFDWINTNTGGLFE